MDKNKLMKEVRKAFKKKTRKWHLDLQEYDNFSLAYDETSNLLSELMKEFTEQEREKWNVNKLKVGVKKLNNNYLARLEF